MMPFPFAHRAEGSSYKHFHVGKWHLGNGQDDPMSPITDGGVTEYRGCLTNPNQHFGVGFGAGYKGGYDDYTQTIATEAGAVQVPHQSLWLGAQEVADSLALLPSDSSPFILRHWFHYGHGPWNDPVPDSALDDRASMRGNAQFPLASGGHSTYSPSSNAQDPAYPSLSIYNLVHRRTKAMVEAADKAIGDVLAGLSAEQRANTIIIIRSDNGTERAALDPSPGQPTFPHEPPPVYDPRHGKGSLYEQGVRVPLIIASHPDHPGPGWIDPELLGTQVDALASTVDVWATIAAATLPNWEAYKTDGESLLPVLSGLTTRVRSHLFSFFFSFRMTPEESCWDMADPARAAVRNEAGYKLIRQVGETDELYDLSRDALERVDLFPPTTPEEIAAHSELSFELDRILSPSTPLDFCFGDGNGTACPCSNDNDGSLHCGRSGCANSTYSSGAVLFALGECSVSNDSVALRVIGASPNLHGLYFQADEAFTDTNALGLNHGLLCVVGNVHRIGSQVANSQGNASSNFAVAARGGVGAGETKRYQFWYRDGAVNRCVAPGTNSNLTNAVEIKWAP